MTHATCMVIVVDTPSPESARHAADKLLAPYEEHSWGDGGKWDWYELGSRYSDVFVRGNIAPLNRINFDRVPFAVLTPDGIWHERGTLGWFGSVTNDKGDKWDWQFRQIIQSWMDSGIALFYDYHI